MCSLAESAAQKPQKGCRSRPRARNRRRDNNAGFVRYINYITILYLPPKSESRLDGKRHNNAPSIHLSIETKTYGGLIPFI